MRRCTIHHNGSNAGPRRCRMADLRVGNFPGRAAIPGWQFSTFFDNSRVVAEIIVLVNSIDPLAPYKASGDLVLELVSVTAIVKEDPEDASAAACRVEIVEPHHLAIHAPPGGYLLDNRQVQMTCANSAGVRLGDAIKLRVVR
jgi:hypothetical protein